MVKISLEIFKVALKTCSKLKQVDEGRKTEKFRNALFDGIFNSISMKNG